MSALVRECVGALGRGGLPSTHFRCQTLPRGAPATAVDDARRAREGRVEANTVRRGNTTATADSTLNRARRERERNVTPRTVTRP